ncbi:aminotransferase class I/II-fold pyridoxal phosphate-dependent enzyme [Clostridium ihumii]|uniref:aminotransferase class I/II-fold pyridoxal phosphate-dependent enzyme n=1 Tax=Clostridium ihumii TaxID=1470356 RepID=UPI0005594D36|nr:aminotransferase class I/II-fold pyridoxal phosphate-dependent enzyme [Clostridium ihumii]
MTNKLPLINGIKNYIDENNIPFSMPGHKCGRGFEQTEEGRKFLEDIIDYDITEVDGVDNLHSPEGIIKESLDLLKEFYGSKKSYYLVNGSTSGNLAMIFSVFNEGDKIIVERNCHRSIYNAIILRKLKPIYISSKINDKYQLPISIDNDMFDSILEENKDAKGIVITYPNYYGICCDLEHIVKRARKYKMKVLVDSAHGAHFKCNDKLPKDALEAGADIVVQSSHKTLSSFTQTAYLHVNHNINIDKVDFYVSTFLSTSPSYLLMASMEYGRFLMEEQGQRNYDELIRLCKVYRERINELSIFHIIDKEDLPNNIDLDESRYIINVNKGYSGHKLLDYLRENNIQCEMSDNRNVLAIFSAFNKEKDVLKLYEVLSKCNIKLLEDNIDIKILENVNPTMKLLPYEVINMEYKSINFKKALGMVCYKSIVPYPPGIPLLMPGEVIDENIIKSLEYYIDNNVTILGLENENIYVVEQ